MKKKNNKNKKSKLSQIEKLEWYEEVGFEAGNASYAAFTETQNLSALKGAISAYRLSMQAIRDQVKFKIAN
jgi:hypothetical protein